MKAGRPSGADFGSALALAVALGLAAFLVLMPVLVLRSHAQATGLGVLAGLVNQQNQSTKTQLYVITFLVVLPLSILAASRIVDAVTAGPNEGALSVLVAAMAGALAVVVVAVRLSGGLPWGAGLGAVLAGALLWWAVAVGVLARTLRGGRWPALQRAAPCARRVWAAVAVLVFAMLLSVTRRSSLNAVPLALGAAILAGMLVARGRIRARGMSRGAGRAVDLLAILVLGLAIPNVVVFHATGGSLPNIFTPPGVLADQQNYLLGSANQLLGGGALLVNVPVSQYGVGLIYFMSGWFHLVPIGYGTAGLLDSLLTALFYIAGYGLLRLAGVGRLLAGAALTVAVVGSDLRHVLWRRSAARDRTRCASGCRLR